MSHSINVGSLCVEEVHRGRTVMILFPNTERVGLLRRALEQCNRPEILQFLHLRASTRHASLKSLALDTLIVVDPQDSDVYGVTLAKERLRTARNPLYIEVKAWL